jgi:hypothetical protein
MARQYRKFDQDFQPGWPAVAAAGLVDQAADHGERGGEVEPELDDSLPFVGAAAQLAVAVHPRVCPLDRPAVPGLDRRGLALDRDLRVNPSRSSRLRVLPES